jgi:hypothetical protein
MSQDGNMAQYQLSFNSACAEYDKATGEYTFTCDDKNRLMRVSLGTLELQPTQTTVSDGFSDIAFSEGIALRGDDAVLTLRRQRGSKGTEKRKIALPRARNAIVAVEREGDSGLRITTENPHGLPPQGSYDLPGLGIVCTPTGLNLQQASIEVHSSHAFSARWDVDGAAGGEVPRAVARQGALSYGTVATARWESTQAIARALATAARGIVDNVEFAAASHALRLAGPWTIDTREGLGRLLGEGAPYDPGTHVVSMVPANYNYGTFSGMLSQCMNGFSFDKDSLLLYIGDEEGTAKVQLPLISTTGYTVPLLEESINAVLADVGLPFRLRVAITALGRMQLSSDNGRCFSVHFDAPKAIIARLLGFDQGMYAGADSYTAPHPCTLVTAGARHPALKYDVTPSTTGVMTFSAKPQRAMLEGSQITSMGLLGVQKGDLVYLSGRGYHHVGEVEFSMRKTSTEQGGSVYIPLMRLQFDGLDSRTAVDGLVVSGVDAVFAMRTDTAQRGKLSPAVYGLPDGQLHAADLGVSSRAIVLPPGDASVRATAPAQLDHQPYVFVTLSSGSLNTTAYNRALTKHGWVSVFAKIEMAGYRVERENAMVTHCPEGGSLGRFRIGIKNPDFTPYRSTQPFSFTLSCTGRIV